MASRVLLETSVQHGSATAAAASNVLFALCSAPSPEAAQVMQIPYATVVSIVYACLHSGVAVKVGARVHLRIFLIVEPNFSRQYLMLNFCILSCLSQKIFCFLLFQLTTGHSIPLLMFSD
jgi:hypothetical protein